jgi:hypothetical protein
VVWSEGCCTAGARLAVTLLRSGLISLCAPGSRAALSRLSEIETVPVLQGLGTALILAIVEQARSRDKQTRAAASAEMLALQAGMNPHFFFNALNTCLTVPPGGFWGRSRLTATETLTLPTL